jgi:GNAT superfamily N-acetyltransferase
MRELTEALYREMREGELPEAVELFLVTVTDMYERHSIHLPAPPRPLVEKFYAHIYRTGIFQVAEVDGRLGAISHAIVRDSQWFLSGFWTLPSLQGKRIGRPLLERVWQEGARAGAKTFFTWSSVDVQAMATYMKMGMLPGYQILNFAGAHQNLVDISGGYESEPLEIQNAMEIDAQVRGARRENDHRFSLEEFKAEGRQVVRNGRAVGYYYFSNGNIGSAAWLDVKDADAVLAWACRDAASQAEQIRFIALGVNHTAIRFALSARLKLISYSHLLTTRPFGQMENYLPSGPSLF